MTTDSNQVCIQFWWNRKVAKAVRKYILGRGEKSNEIELGWGVYHKVAPLCNLSDGIKIFQYVKIITDLFRISSFYLDRDVGVKSKLTHLVPPGR